MTPRLDYNEQRLAECIRDGTAVDIGDNHWITWFQWAPDRELNPQYGADQPDIPKAGVIVFHRRPDGALCSGAVTFDFLPGPGPRWQVQSLDPLTISPSVLCTWKDTPDGPVCGDHGFIREGRWVRA